MNSSSWGSIERDIDALLDCCFDLGKDGVLFCEWEASLESCNMINSSCKDLFLLLLNGSMKCWAEVFCTDVVWMLWVWFIPPAKIIVFSDNRSLVCDPSVIVPVDLDPKIGVVYLDKFDRDMVFPEVDVISSFGVSLSVVFKVCVYFDMCWEIVLLSPMNSFVFISEFANKYYCCQGVTGVCPVFQGCLRKA